MIPNDFIAKIAPTAQSSQVTTNIYSSFVIAEAALESGWGSSQLYVQANNIFGVKADSSWKGDTFSLQTNEYIDGKNVIVPALWRKYPDMLSCITDHASFLMNNHRYAPAFETNNVNDFVTAIAQAGYATDPNYSQKIMEIINFHNLTQYDQVTS